MSPTVLRRSSRPQQLRGVHVLIAILAFFAAIFLVNGTMIYSAISTYSGVVANEPYRKGLKYNDRIAAGQRQAVLGWNGTLDVNREGAMRLILTEADGRPVRGMKVAGVIGRPSTNRDDIAFVMSETSPGRYEAHAGALEEGNWLVWLDARWQETAEPVYRVRRRLWLKP